MLKAPSGWAVRRRSVSVPAQNTSSSGRASGDVGGREKMPFKLDVRKLKEMASPRASSPGIGCPPRQAVLKHLA